MVEEPAGGFDQTSDLLAQVTGQNVLLSTWSAANGQTTIEDGCLGDSSPKPCELDEDMTSISGTALRAGAKDVEVDESGLTDDIRAFLDLIVAVIENEGENKEQIIDAITGTFKAGIYTTVGLGTNSGADTTLDIIDDVTPDDTDDDLIDEDEDEVTAPTGS